MYETDIISILVYIDAICVFLNIILSIVRWKQTKKIGIGIFISILLMIVRYYLLETFIDTGEGYIPPELQTGPTTEPTILEKIGVVSWFGISFIQIIIILKLIIGIFKNRKKEEP